MDPPTSSDSSDPELFAEPTIQQKQQEPKLYLPRFKDQVNEATFHVDAVFPKHIVKPQISADSQQTPANSDDTTPFADVRFLTNSVLFLNPQALEIDAAPEALPIDRSVLTTGFAEDQFPPEATRRPAFVTVTIMKPEADTGLGVFLSTDAGCGAVYISQFKENAPLSRVLALSPLGVGDKLLSVNETPCAGLTNPEIAALIRSVSGPLTVAIENVSGDPSLVETMVEKETAESNVGLGFRYTFLHGGYVQISKVSGMFANSFVEVGDRIVLVNGEKVGSVESAKSRIAASTRFVSVTVESLTGVVLPVPDEGNENGITENGLNGGGKEVKQTSAPSPDAASCSCCIM